jgi:hypothetical protein
VLVAAPGTGLTWGELLGKNIAVSRNKQGMTTHGTHLERCADSSGLPADVVAWRARRLREAGFSVALTEALLVQRVDLHALLQLVDASCPPELAARILSPVDDIRTAW